MGSFGPRPAHTQVPPEGLQSPVAGEPRASMVAPVPGKSWPLLLLSTASGTREGTAELPPSPLHSPWALGRV